MHATSAAAPASIAIIINPISGASGRPHGGARRAGLAREWVRRRGVQASVSVTEAPGHAPALAADAVSRGASLIIAWGGDGTVNEIAGALVGATATLGIVPAGSGNGLARHFGIGLDAGQALDQALDGAERPLDAGEIGGRLFFNLAGIGFDAEVAKIFNARTSGARGFAPYIKASLRLGLTYRARRYVITSGDDRRTTRALMIVLANGREYGNGLVIAPAAETDDGLLEIVAVEQRGFLVDVWRARRVFNGTVAVDPGVQIHRGHTITLESDHPMCAHADGEAVAPAPRFDVRVHPAAVRVRVPRRTP